MAGSERSSGLSTDSQWSILYRRQGLLSPHSCKVIFSECLCIVVMALPEMMVIIPMVRIKVFGHVKGWLTVCCSALWIRADTPTTKSPCNWLGSGGCFTYKVTGKKKKKKKEGTALSSKRSLLTLPLIRHSFCSLQGIHKRQLIGTQSEQRWIKRVVLCSRKEKKALLFSSFFCTPAEMYPERSLCSCTEEKKF